MAEHVSPTVARRHLRLALREARETADLTQLEVAGRMEWSLSKVIRIENGDVRISPNDLRPLLTLLNIRDRAIVAGLLDYAKVARTRQRSAWYQQPEFRQHLTEPLTRLIEYEAEADEIRYYQVFFVPGPLQTPAYARASLAVHRDDDIPAMTRHYRAEARLRRRDAVVSRLGELRIHALLDESVFLRPFGGPEVFAEQLKDLLDRVVSGQIKVRMIPFSAYSAVSNNATFDLLTLQAGDPSSDVLYIEAGLGDQIVEDASQTLSHHERFDRVWNVAATEEETIGYLRGRIKELEAQPRD